MLSITLSIIAILISIATAWFNLFHKGKVKITTPGFFAIMPSDGDTPNCPKVFLRALLFTTGKRGRALESLLVKINRDGNIVRFLHWSYGERERLVPGSGIYVGPEGVESNYHFVQLDKDSSYRFQKGNYQIDIIAKAVDQLRPIKLQTLTFTITEEQSAAINSRHDAALFFWFDAEKNDYESRIDITQNYKFKS